MTSRVTLYHLRLIFGVVLLSLFMTSHASPLVRRNTGDATNYTPGLGSCGQTNTEADMVVAVHTPQCGKQISATYQGKTIKVKVVDTCPACAEGDLDLSPAAFGQWADASAYGPGRLHGVQWNYV
ncbi:hypothetical protein K435DRAFT_804188 [Dendrothele bispora CBS 962.96]|uniref:RlpA-like protein double-psi beta-barrel domain-containing protein n=1 Tax=Dendrothele bispora (strain CBS 962.96) TaxID=1314807 RepID=A0A4S8LEZ8_DENBC|nr:hypothetical protein K435DRAFT_804188 [Dendrothele bispora CBS 962.96]